MVADALEAGLGVEPVLRDGEILLDVGDEMQHAAGDKPARQHRDKRRIQDTPAPVAAEVAR